MKKILFLITFVLVSVSSYGQTPQDIPTIFNFKYGFGAGSSGFIVDSITESDTAMVFWNSGDAYVTSGGAAVNWDRDSTFLYLSDSNYIDGDQISDSLTLLRTKDNQQSDSLLTLYGTVSDAFTEIGLIKIRNDDQTDSIVALYDTAALHKDTLQLHASQITSILSDLDTKLNETDTTAMLSSYLQYEDTISHSIRSDTSFVLKLLDGKIVDDSTDLGSVSFGADNQIPVINVTDDDFEYFSGFKFNGTSLWLQPEIIHGSSDVTNMFINNSGMGSRTSTAIYNTFLGDNAGESLTQGDRNVIVGTNAGNSITTGAYNTVVGSFAGRSFSTHDGNTFVGFDAGMGMVGESNTVVGREAGDNNTSGSSNVFIGDNTGAGSIVGGYTGSRNVFIGNEVGATLNTQTDDLLMIDNTDTATPLLWGDFSLDSMNINGALSVTGTIYQGGSPIGTGGSTDSSSITYEVDTLKDLNNFDIVMSVGGREWIFSSSSINTDDGGGPYIQNFSAAQTVPVYSFADATNRGIGKAANGAISIISDNGQTLLDGNEITTSNGDTVVYRSDGVKGDSNFVMKTTEQVWDSIAFSSTINVDFTSGSDYKMVVVTGACTINVTDLYGGESVLWIIQDGTGSHTVTKGTGWGDLRGSGTISTDADAISVVQWQKAVGPGTYTKVIHWID